MGVARLNVLSTAWGIRIQRAVDQEVVLSSNLEVISAYKTLADLQQSFQAWPVHYRRYSTNNKRIEDI